MNTVFWERVDETKRTLSLLVTTADPCELVLQLVTYSEGDKKKRSDLQGVGVSKLPLQFT